MTPPLSDADLAASSAFTEQDDLYRNPHYERHYVNALAALAEHRAALGGEA